MGEYRTSNRTCGKLYEKDYSVDFNLTSNHKINNSNYAQIKLIKRLWRLAIWSSAYVILVVATQLLSGNGLVVEGKNLNLKLESIDQEVTENKLNCTPLTGTSNFPEDIFTEDQREHGAILVHFIASLYIFYTVLVICDEYFVPSVECICTELKISSDVAGATFMAIATSAPELFTNFIGTFVTQGDIGVGTIVGSAVFNVLVVATACGIGSAWNVGPTKTPDVRDRKGLPLEWFPLTRDTFFYVASVGALILVLYDVRVDWYEALALLLLYSLYILVLTYNGTIKKIAEGIVYKIQISCFKGSGKKHRRISVAGGSLIKPKPHESTPLLYAENERGIVRPAKIDGETVEGEESEMSLSSNDFDEMMISIALSRSVSHCIETKTDWGIFVLPRGQSWKIWIEYILAWPIRFSVALTIPDCRLQNFAKWYPLTLIMCIVWIGGLTYILSWMMTVIGDTIGIPESVTGLTFLAAGTSIPEIVSSIIVARQGLGAMALSNSVGSNTFDILVCLGFPWLVKLLVIYTSDINYIQINSEGMEYSAILMITTIVLLYIILAWNKFYLDVKVGIISFIMYIIFITLAILLEMNVFFDVHPPAC